MGNASPWWHVDISSCWALAVQSWAAINLQGHTSSRNIFVSAVRAICTHANSGTDIHIIWGREAAMDNDFSHNIMWTWFHGCWRWCAFRALPSTLPSIPCGVVDLVTRWTSEASKACISFLNVWYLFSGWLFVLLEAWKWFHIVVQCKLAMNLCSSWSGNNHSVSSVRQTTCLSCMV